MGTKPRGFVPILCCGLDTDLLAEVLEGKFMK